MPKSMRESKLTLSSSSSSRLKRLSLEMIMIK